MYRILTALVFIAILAWIVQLIRAGRINKNSIQNYINDDIQALARFFSQPKSESHTGILDILRKGFFYMTSLLFAVLGISGFLPKLIFGMDLSGWLLIIHVTIAPFFAVSLTVFLLLSAAMQQYNARDWCYILQRISKSSKTNNNPINTLFWQKTLFWLFMIISLVAILPIILSMFPLFGTAGQHTLLVMHQYSVLALTIILSIALVLQFSVIKDER